MDMGDFFSQLPPIFPILLIASVLLIGAGFAILIFSGKSKDKPRKNKDVPLPDVPAMKSVAPPAAPAARQAAADSWALPDIDQLTPAAPPQRPSGSYRLTLTSGESVEAAEVMVLLRNMADGSMIAQIGDKSYTCPPIGADADFLRRYTIAVRDLPPAAADAPRSTRPAPATPPPVAPVSASPAPSSAAAKQPAAAPASAGNSSSDIPGDLPKFTSPESTEAPRLGRRPTATAPIPEINIAAAIESYLQYRLSTDERFAGRNIHLLPAGADGVRIEVDGQTYQHIDDVTDSAVQAFLRDTVTEWQSRQ